MKTNGGFLVTKIKQLGDRIFEKILSEKNIAALTVTFVFALFFLSLPIICKLMKKQCRSFRNTSDKPGSADPKPRFFAE
mgnify:CR=1 FL=1